VTASGRRCSYGEAAACGASRGAGAAGGACCGATLRGATSAALAEDGSSSHGAALQGSPSDPCTCPPFAVKATCGKRPIMEDTYALCPNICELPMPPMAVDFADKLPQRIAVQLAHGEPSTEDCDAASPAGTSAGPAPGGRDGGGGGSGGSGSTFGSSVDGVCALEKLHFFGVYDGHGGIQASQHCAARLHHHLSAALRGMAASLLAQAVVGSVESAASLEALPEGPWQQAVVPEVRGQSDARGRRAGR
jgi:hypothetical protein